MGAEAICAVRFKRKTVAGTAKLETAVLQFRGGDLKLNIPFNDMSKVTARGGALTVTFSGGVAAFEVGDAAPKWAHNIQHPPSRFEKIGVKPEWRASAVGVDDQAFLTELKAAVAHLSVGRTLKDSDAIFFGAVDRSCLAS